ncbi:MAG: hypothetical protein D3903_20665 [Candidatus Electrothrix sp. GM3_4]|nr:hypothetical protein [Candidatus Electrothrix sp. GM3_4]
MSGRQTICIFFLMLKEIPAHKGRELSALGDSPACCLPRNLLRKKKGGPISPPRLVVKLLASLP